MRIHRVCLLLAFVFLLSCVPCLTQDSGTRDAENEQSHQEMSRLIETLDERLKNVTSELKQFLPQGDSAISSELTMSNSTKLHGQCKKDLRVKNIPILDKRKCSIFSEIGHLSKNPSIQKRIFDLEAAKLKSELHNNKMMFELEAVRKHLTILKKMSNFVQIARNNMVSCENSTANCIVDTVTKFFFDFDDKDLLKFTYKINEMNKKATKLKNDKDYTSAMKLYEEVITLRGVFYSDETEETLDTKFWAAWTLEKLNRNNESFSMYEQLLEKRRKVLGNNHEDTITTINNIGHVLYKMEQYSSALKYYDEAIERGTKVLGIDHVNTLSYSYNKATTLYHLGRYDDALKLLQIVLEKRNRILDHIDTLSTKFWTARILEKLNRNNESISMYEQLIEKQRKVLGSNHQDTITTINNIGHVLYKMEQYSSALKYYDEAVERGTKVLGIDHVNTLLYSYNRATTLYHLGRYDDALKLLQIVLEKRNRILGEYHSDTLNTLSWYTWTLKKLNRN